jgi:hypothetical protein
MNCCDDSATARSLIHDLSSPWIDQNEPVLVSLFDSHGEYLQFVVTGVTSMGGTQELDLQPVDDGAIPPRRLRLFAWTFTWCWGSAMR